MSEPIASVVQERHETEAWLKAYASGEAIERRRAALPRELESLGVTELDRGSRVLDLCCGHGEALGALHDLGFRDLCGVDLSIDASLAADPRFEVRQGNALSTGYPDESLDAVLSIHSMHHFATVENVRRFLDESYRMLKPGGLLGVVDFARTMQIRAAFWFFRQNRFMWTPYLRWFAAITNEEWPFLKDYLPHWPEVRRLLMEGRFQVVSNRKSLFYFHLALRKPIAQGGPR